MGPRRRILRASRACAIFTASTQIFSVCSFAFPRHLSSGASNAHCTYANHRRIITASALFAGGFGTKPSSTKKPKRMNPNQAKKATQQLLDRYGGDIQKGTQSRIDAALSSLPSHIQQAASLYKQLTQFDALIAPMTEPDRKRLIPPEQWAVSASNRNTLQQLMKEHSITENDLHNIYQKITWDASADAKATRADIAGNAMKDNLQERISRACEITVEAVASNSDNHDRTGMLLDIGCGHGSIIPSLDNLAHDSYVGIDLSDEMIRNARERYGDADARGKKRVFVADDFLTHDFSVYARQDGMNDSQNNGSDIFDAVMFCSSLHDLPDMEHCIGRAASLLRSGGKLVVVHAQGAMHVVNQHQSNPVMVQRSLPTASEWNEMIIAHKDDWKLSLEYQPADPRSARDEREGYLAVLVKE